MVSRRRPGLPAAVAALVALAGLSLGRVYNGPLMVGLVAGAALGSVVISTRLRRARAWLVAPLSVLVLSGYVVAAVALSARAGGVTGDLRLLTMDAARNAVPRLLTALIPVEAQPDTVVGPVVFAWLAGFAGAELAARARRPALALVPPALLYLAALVLVGPNAEVAFWQPLAFAAVAALGLVAAGGADRYAGIAGGSPRARLRSSGPTPRRPLRSGALPRRVARQQAALRLRIATGLAFGLVSVLAVAAVLGPVVGASVWRTPTDPRRYVVPPSLDVLDLNPLIRISGWASNPKQKLFTVTVLHGVPRPSPAASGASPGDVAADGGSGDAVDGAGAEAGGPDAGYDTRLRLAVLADWDGVTWHVLADYRNAGRVLPDLAAAPGAGEDTDKPGPLTIKERITVADLQGRLLPAVAAPRRVEGIRVAYDPSTGTLLQTARLASGTTYTVTSENPSVDVNLLPAADVPSGPQVARYLAVGDVVPADLSHLAEQIMTGAGSPYLKAQALESFLAEHYRFTAEAPSGHAYPNLRFFLFDDARAGGGRGTSEQFAAAFATLGRLMGLPTRVVVGFRTPAGGGAVTAGDALAWPEVLFAGVGWVPFDPMPRPDTPPRPLEDEYLPKPTPPTSPPSSIEPSDAPTWTPPATPGSGAAAGPGGPGGAVLAGGVGGGFVVVAALLVALIVLLRARQRRVRLDRGSAPNRVLGAWEEVLDALTLAGAPPPPHLAAAEVATHAAGVARAGAGPRHVHNPRPAAPPLQDLAAKVNTVGFSGVSSALPGGADDLVAAAARVRAVEFARALRSHRPWWRRLLWTLDPRPLRRRR